MKESLRKPILFAAIVVIGSVFVLFDIPLIVLLPLILLVGFGVLLAVGSVTIAEIRSGIAGLGKSGFLRRLNEIKFFEKKPSGVKKPTPPAPVKAEAKKEGKTPGEVKPGIGAHVSAFFSSVMSLGSILQQRSRQGKKVEDINNLLDQTVSEKVSAPPPSATPAARPAGSGGAGAKSTQDTDDPFMSLSGDEFDEGLLDGLDDELGAGPSSPAAPAPKMAPLPDMTGMAEMPDMTGMDDLPEPGADNADLPAPGPDIDPAAGDILKSAGEDAGGGLEEFSGLDGGDVSDEDFGDLDGLTLDDVNLEGEGEPASPAIPEPAPAPAAVPAAGNPAVKTAWIPSDAPKDAGETNDEISTQADMASFAGGGGGDEDLLSSIASDVKHVKKDVDISLVRELKDFRAPATEIEQELGGMYERMNQAQQKKRNIPAGTKGIK